MQSDLRRKAGSRLEQKYQTVLNQAQIVESKLLGDLQRGTSQATAAGPKLQQAEEIQADLERLQARYATVDERISNIELESSSPGSVHLFSPAMTPLSPEKSKIKLLLLLIFPFSIFMGVLGAVTLDFFDTNIYTASDVEAVLGFTPIGMLFDDREVTQMVFDQCALRLAAGVDHASRVAGARTFVITSVNTGAGTTTVVECLGSMLAKLGRKTLVIDSSGNNEPVAYVTFGTSLEKQSVDLSEKTATTTQLQPTIPSGKNTPTRVSPFSSTVFQGFQAITSEYDIVLIDAAPLLLSAETEYLARMADVTILLAEAGKTKKAWLTRTARLLEKLGVAGAAAVVNKVHPARAEADLVQDMHNFESRVDRMNLTDWWTPSGKSAKTTPNSSFGTDSQKTDQEDSVFARDI